MSKSDKKLFLLDAYALIYRAHFAFTKTPRINSKGVNTSVPFGFTNTLLEVLTKQRPTHIAVAFDTTAKTFRDEIFKEYKATRQETPEDIRSGIPVKKEAHLDGTLHNLLPIINTRYCCFVASHECSRM